MTIEPRKLEFSCTADQFRVAVHGKGVKVEIDADGNVTVYSNGGVKTRPFEQLPTLATGASAEALKVGASMPDGSIYAGVSPDTGKPMYATPKDAPMTAISTRPPNTPRNWTRTATRTGACRQRPS